MFETLSNMSLFESNRFIHKHMYMCMCIHIHIILACKKKYKWCLHINYVWLNRSLQCEIYYHFYQLNTIILLHSYNKISKPTCFVIWNGAVVQDLTKVVHPLGDLIHPLPSGGFKGAAVAMKSMGVVQISQMYSQEFCERLAEVECPRCWRGNSHRPFLQSAIDS